jgi:hypothetical protein
MKKFSNVLLIIFSLIIALVSLVFVIIEGRLILSFDWTLHEHEFLGFLQYLARLGIAALCLATSISSVVYHNRKSFVFEGIVFLVTALVLSIFATNGFGLYFTIAAVVYLASAVFHHFMREK